MLSGNRIQKWNGVVQNRDIENYETMEDTVSEGDNMPFTLTRAHHSGGLISGTEKSNLSGYVWNGYPFTDFSNPWYRSHAPVNSTEADGWYATQTLARTNPNRSSMDAVVSAIELREIPPLIRDELDEAKRNLYKFIPRGAFKALKRTAKLNLIIQFGILPLIGDLKTLYNFQPLVDQRVNELERLRSRGLRRTVTLDELEGTAERLNTTVQSQGTSIRADLHKRTKVTVRGHVRWRATTNFTLCDNDKRREALNIVLGNTFDPSAIYELTPWSWLIDYFTNLGTFVKANRNTIPVVHDTPRIMTHRLTTTNCSRITCSDSRISCTPPNSVYESKVRRVVSASVTARTNFLSGSQWSILASLSVLKGK